MTAALATAGAARARTAPDTSTALSFTAATLPPGRPEGHGSHDGRDLGYLPPLDVLRLERGLLDRPHGVPVAVTAVGEHLPGALEAILPPGEALVACPHVLYEQQPAPRLQ